MLKKNNKIKNLNIEALNRTQVYDIIQLFALIVMVDGIASKKEVLYVKKYIHSLFSEDFGAFIYKEFTSFVKESENISLEKVCSSLAKKQRYDEKIFIMFKLVELMFADYNYGKNTDIPVELFNQHEILTKIGVSLWVNVRELDSIQSYVINPTCDVPSVEPGEFIIPLSISGNNSSHINLGIPNLSIIVAAVNKRFFLIKKDSVSRVRINKKIIEPNITTKIPRNGEITINEEYIISHNDIKLYYRQRMLKKFSFFMHEHSSDFFSSKELRKDSKLEFVFTSNSILLKRLSDELAILINGKPTPEEGNLRLNDELIVNNHKIDIRRLASSYLLNSSDAAMTESNSIVVGNQYDCNIFLEDELDYPWRFMIFFNVHDNFRLENENCPYPIFLNNVSKTRGFDFLKEDFIRVGNYVIGWDETHKIFKTTNTSVKRIVVENIDYKFIGGKKGVDNISFETERGELIAIMGPSGSGKSTLVNVLNGLFIPHSGSVTVGGINLHENYSQLKEKFAFVPQDDLLFENLTAYQNLIFNAKLRYPSEIRNVESLVDSTLRELDLYEKKDNIVGSVEKRVMSGGERKRLNIAIELMSNADVLFFDEPTSGLSSRDSENIMRILKELALKGKIVFVVIHQPSTKIFDEFDKLILLDQGGKLAFFGDTISAFEYFEPFSDQISQIDWHQTSNRNPDYLLDALEQRLKDIDGGEIKVRKYSPDFWKELYQQHKLDATTASDDDEESNRHSLPPPSVIKLKDKARRFRLLLRRNFINKIRDKNNIFITFLFPPLLGMIVAFILCYSPYGDYSFGKNTMVPVFLFLANLLAIFLGLSNSVEDFIKEKNIMKRERVLNISSSFYYFSKVIPLIGFSIIQNILFFGIGFAILGGRELDLYVGHILLLSVISLIGIGTGLLLSCLPNLTTKAASNLLPIVLVPQIIFSGALVEFTKMSNEIKYDKNNPIPEICQFMPIRWGYESMLSLQYLENTYNLKAKDYENKWDSLRKNNVNNTYRIEVAKMEDSIRYFKNFYQKKHGNESIQGMIDNAEIKYETNSKKQYEFGLPRKNIFTWNVPTYIYNSLILLAIFSALYVVTILLMRFMFR